ncbi:uncharacterized protein LOC122025190 [Zingiber officinale]|uniref:uncharacterized protein LOC122025190 n=1 Tax=Zingiber officinale TaxID=94328 RepID=UPI001C4AE49A|nr:uncharacterized protein LOC122025190 [Zingiber officinale]
MFEINSARLKLYAEAFERLKGSFQEVVIQKIPWSENQVADELAKLASAVTPVVASGPIEQVGDLVWKRVKPVGDVRKLEAPWAGAYKVVERVRSSAYYLEDAEGRRLDQSWSANHLQPYRAG